MIYTEALQYLHSFLNFEKMSPFSYRREFNLERMKRILGWFCNPHRQFKSILIAGTKGKGSTAFFTERLLSAHGFRTGLYTSPHLSDFRERIRIGTRLIEKNPLRNLTGKMKRVIGQNQKSIRHLGPVTFFEVTTTLAFLYFAEQKIDWAVLEVGMGGRLDATNVVNQSLSVIALIGMDHEEHLGKTIKRIAGEKAAIIKSNVPVICAEQKREAFAVIQTQAKKQATPIYLAGRDFEYKNVHLNQSKSEFDFVIARARSGRSNPRFARLLRPYRTRNDSVFCSRCDVNARNDSVFCSRCDVNARNDEKFEKIQLRLPGSFQVKNAALALASFCVLSNQFGFKPNQKEVRSALKSNEWPGRFEILRRGKVTYILDSAHNPESVDALSDSISRFFKGKRLITIFGLSREKNLAVIYPKLSRISTTMIATQSNQPRANSPKTMMEQIEFGGNVLMCESIREALGCVKRITDNNTIILITGSLFLVGEARNLLKCQTSF